jgi:thymidylate kinase
MKKDSIRKVEQKFEKNKEFIEKLRKNYLGLPGVLKGYKIIVIDGTKPIEDIFENQIKPRIDELWSKYEKG